MMQNKMKSVMLISSFLSNLTVAAATDAIQELVVKDLFFYFLVFTLASLDSLFISNYHLDCGFTAFWCFVCG